MKRTMMSWAMLCCLAVGCGAPDDESEPVSLVSNELRVRGDLAEPVVDDTRVIATRDSKDEEGGSTDDRCDLAYGDCVEACGYSIPLEDRVGWLLVAYRMCCDDCATKLLACKEKAATMSSASAGTATSVDLSASGP